VGGVKESFKMWEQQLLPTSNKNYILTVNASSLFIIIRILLSLKYRK